MMLDYFNVAHSERRIAPYRLLSLKALCSSWSAELPSGLITEVMM